ncbi:hypothetical protein DY130_04860 [Apilactobacillus micheneri]|uniref:Uncharacterized protein n=1 Tax=Apilactobacillus micheneri TaxID=1899430 RepID=A0A9Q8MTM6_9LACO|nr:hypothetical protein [Apilactobacillus micheneri]TPR39844.1 hypothetical protein DY121_04865 [Apilactobacillus micheneri]TPR43765.1 hypothetical protein DY130_04860 [Apilactobacillus micheneri]TPR45318.1 hypothetical protein DY128_04860 [Apilactobacillus micheneri]
MKTNWKIFGLNLLFFVLPLLIVFIPFNVNNDETVTIIKLLIWFIYCMAFILFTKLFSKNHPKIKQLYENLINVNNSFKNKDPRMLKIYVISIAVVAVLVAGIVFILETFVPKLNSAFVIPMVVMTNIFFLQCTDFNNIK